MTRKIKAAVMLKPGELELREFDKPELGRDAIWLKVDYAGVCGTDKHSYLGHANYDYPLIPGHEFVGTIAEMGRDANEAMILFGGPLKVGDRVAVGPGPVGCGKCWYCLNTPLQANLCPNKAFVAYGFTTVERPPYLWGAFAEYIYLQPDTYVFRLDDDLSSEVAALTEPTATALGALNRACRPGIPLQGEGYGPNQNVVVLGAGPIGLMTIVALKHSGAAQVIAVDLLENRLQLARKMGADVVINAQETTFEERLERIRDLTEGVGCDTLVEAAGVPVAFKEGLRFVRRGGVFVEVGHFTDPGAVEIHPFTICEANMMMIGSFSYPRIMFKHALTLLKRTPAPITDLITHKLPLEDIEKAFELAGTKDACKVLIEP